MQLSGELPRNRAISTPPPAIPTRTMQLKDLELHCEQLQALLHQLRTEKEFVEKENVQLRESLQPTEGEDARSAKISVWLGLERTRQAVRLLAAHLRGRADASRTSPRPPSPLCRRSS